MLEFIAAAQRFQHREQIFAKLALGGLVFVAAAPLVFATPAHAADGNAISLSVDPALQLLPSGDLYKVVTNIGVRVDNSTDFSLTMRADTADLVNRDNAKYKISAVPSATPTALGDKQWGYALAPQATQFSKVPAKPDAPVELFDTTVDGKRIGCDCANHCKTSITFAAKFDPTKLASGSYSTKITYTAVAKVKPAPVVAANVCRSGDLINNDCKVDLDDNMIPVKYTGDTTNAQWTSLANPEDSSNQGNWYNYNQKQWANAVTVKDPSKYRGKEMVVDQVDVLGYWVYIPRYAYEVMRRDTTDAPVPAQNFAIHFEKANDRNYPKRYPAVSKCSGRNSDYRITCDLDRNYIKGQPSERGTWATHPAFTFGKKELNGIWFAKFETTGSFSAPTVKPNLQHITGDVYSYYGNNRQIGGFYTSAKSIGVTDDNNSGGIKLGDEDEDGAPEPNNHHLKSYNSRFINNKDWGAAAYLSASEYGAGASGVHNNGQIDDRGDAYGSYGITGCGPYNEHDDGSYANTNAQMPPKHRGEAVGKLGTQAACSANNLQRAYNGTIGQLASTTNNPTGIYDMAGGAAEYTAARYSQTLDGAKDSLMGDTVRPPYVNLYNFTNFNSCTFDTCGGQALYETTGVNKVKGTRWNSGYAMFVGKDYPWFERGGDASNGSGAGIFATYAGAGYAYFRFAFRVVLGSFAQ